MQRLKAGSFVHQDTQLPFQTNTQEKINTTTKIQRKWCPGLEEPKGTLYRYHNHHFLMFGIMFHCKFHSHSWKASSSKKKQPTYQSHHSVSRARLSLILLSSLWPHEETPCPRSFSVTIVVSSRLEKTIANLQEKIRVYYHRVPEAPDLCLHCH